MKKQFPVIFLLSLTLSGCFIAKLHNKVFNPPDCSKPSPFSTVIITPFSTDDVLIEGITEGKEMTNIGSGLKFITTSMGETLKDRLVVYKKFEKISQDNACAANAIKIDGKVIYFAHVHRKGFVALVRGSVISCDTGEPLYKFDVKEDDNELYGVPDKIAREIANGIYDKLLCQSTDKINSQQK